MLIGMTIAELMKLFAVHPMGVVTVSKRAKLYGLAALGKPVVA